MLSPHPSKADEPTSAENYHEPSMASYLSVLAVILSLVAAGLFASSLAIEHARKSAARADAVGYFQACRDLHYEPSFCVQITRKVHGFTMAENGDVVAEPVRHDGKASKLDQPQD